MSGWDASGGSAWDNYDSKGAASAGDSAASVSYKGDSAGAFGEPAGDSGGAFGVTESGVGGTFSGGCFNCGEEGHSKANCPKPAKAQPCFKCGEEGHVKADCKNASVPREFDGTCRLCEQHGHRAADCPSAPPRICKNCQGEGHSIAQCTNPRKIDRSDIDTVSGEKAWAELRAASDEGDLDDMKSAVEKYIKAIPDITYVDLENAFRGQNVNLYVVAVQKELAPTFTNMDLQGNLGREFSVTFRKSPNHVRPKEKDGWPPSVEENLVRLKNAGEPVDCGLPKCSNCDEMGHIAKSCPQEKTENPDRVVLQCSNCQEVGHRLRDCPVPREDKFACRNCKQSGHSSKECTEPRDASSVECKKCGEVGHFARDCPQSGGGGLCHNCHQEGHRSKDCTNERVMKCRNCDEIGHASKECPKPRDYSRVKCSNCQQMGHTKVRCKEPIVEEGTEHAGGDGGGNTFGAPGANDAAGGDAFGASGTGEDSWGASNNTTGGW